MDYFYQKRVSRLRDKNTRKHVKCKIKVAFYAKTESGDDLENPEYLIGFIRSISPFSIELESRRTLAEETLLVISIKDPQYPPYEFTGVVKWVKENTALPIMRKATGKAKNSKPGGGTADDSRYSKMGVDFGILSEEFEGFLNDLILEHQKLPKDDPYYNAVVVNFKEPEDLYWEYHNNLSKGRMFIPTSFIFKPGDVVKMQIRIRANMEIIRAKVEVINHNEAAFGSEKSYWMLVKILEFAEQDQDRFEQYLESIIKAIDDENDDPSSGKAHSL